MFTKIISFIILLLTVFYFSAGVSDNEDDNYYVASSHDKHKFNDYTICVLEMMSIFGRTVPRRNQTQKGRKRTITSTPAAITCVKKAITKLKLLGKYRSTLGPHVIKYYELFHLYVDPKNIKTPKEFCTDNETNLLNAYCAKALSVFKLDLGFDHLLPNDIGNMVDFDPKTPMFTEEESIFLLETLNRPPIHAAGDSLEEMLTENLLEEPSTKRERTTEYILDDPSTERHDPTYAGDYVPYYTGDYSEELPTEYNSGMSYEELFGDDDLMTQSVGSSTPWELSTHYVSEGSSSQFNTGGTVNQSDSFYEENEPYPYGSYRDPLCDSSTQDSEDPSDKLLMEVC